MLFSFFLHAGHSICLTSEKRDKMFKLGSDLIDVNDDCDLFLFQNKKELP